MHIKEALRQCIQETQSNQADQKTVDVSKFVLSKQQVELANTQQQIDTKIKTINITIQPTEIECKSGGIIIGSLNSEENQKNNDNRKENITQINLILNNIHKASAENNDVTNNGINIKTTLEEINNITVLNKAIAENNNITNNIIVNILANGLSGTSTSIAKYSYKNNFEKSIKMEALKHKEKISNINALLLEQLNNTMKSLFVFFKHFDRFLLILFLIWLFSNFLQSAFINFIFTKMQIQSIGYVIEFKHSFILSCN
ncbi:putative methyltransferase [Reticulomyxa filosa]|uniref:Putative methyltransferase n=1 Tax=Reticulomyxa filosa TaxID=46433 RepID=X6P202_RETFI|nr:putative methyltransferase [Reticulomyxa filosa]|eukprot:ETO32575.1 putative methyltransferase [Reticulomyxa filosa]